MGGQIDQRVLHDTDPGGVRRGGVASADAANSSPFNPQFALGWWINEAPFVGLWWVIAGTIGTLVHPEVSWWWWLVAAFAAVDGVLLGWIAVRARSARPALSEALQTAYGRQAKPLYTRPAWWRLLLPIVSWRPDVRRVRNQRNTGSGPAREPARRLRVPPRSRRERVSASAGVLPRQVCVRQQDARLPCVDLPPGRPGLGVRQRRPPPIPGRISEATRRCAGALAGCTTTRRHTRAIPIASSQPEGPRSELAATAAMNGSDVAAVIGMYGYYGSVDAGSGSTSPQDVVNRMPTVLHHSRHPRHPGPAPRGRAFADRVRAFYGYRSSTRTPRCAAQLRLLPVDPLPRRHRCDSAFRGTHAGVDGAKRGERPTRGSESEEPVVTRPAHSVGDSSLHFNAPPRWVACSDADPAGAVARAERINAEGIVERSASPRVASGVVVNFRERPN